MADEPLRQAGATQRDAGHVPAVRPIPKDHLGASAADGHKHGRSTEPMRSQHTEIDQPCFLSAADDPQGQLQARSDTTHKRLTARSLSHRAGRHRFHVINPATPQGRCVAPKHGHGAALRHLGQCTTDHTLFAKPRQVALSEHDTEDVARMDGPDEQVDGIGAYINDAKCHPLGNFIGHRQR
jgi:hypothetical protein